MYIQHNMAAETASRFMKENTVTKLKCMEKLSSGYKVNRAADDAASLTISEKMRGQIWGLYQAVSNVQDGMSLINVADGGMKEIHSMLHRIRELCVQSGNDTYVTKDRLAISEEIAKLIDDIDYIGKNTEFNTIKVLQGEHIVRKQVGTRLEDIITYEEHEGAKEIFGLDCTQRYYLSNTYNLMGGIPDSSIDPHAVQNGMQLDFSKIASKSDWKKLHDASITFNCTLGCKQEFTIQFDNNKSGIQNETTKAHIVLGGSTNNVIFTIGTARYTKGEDLVTDLLKYIGELDPTNSGQSVTDNVLVGHDNKIGTTNGKDIIIYGSNRGWEDNGFMHVGKYTVTKDVEVPVYRNMKEKVSVYIQAGANAKEMIQIDLPRIDSETLRMNQINIMNSTSATKSISYADKMIEELSQHRARMGALYNRMEHTYNSNVNSAENHQNAESRIRDADIADEMVNLTRKMIMEQSIQAMLAHANQQPEGILALLQG